MRDILAAMALSALGYGISCFVHLPWGLDIALFVQGYLMLGRWLRLVGVQIIITDILLSTIVEGDYGTIFYVWQAGMPIAILGILLPIYVSRHWAQKPFLRYLGL